MSGRSRIFKHSVEELLGSSLALAVGRRRLRGARLTLAYHNIVRAEQPPLFADSPLHLPLHRFYQQLDIIEEAGLAVVGIDHPRGDSDGPPQIAITFDDAYRGAVTLALPELAKRGLPATVFVAPGLLNCPAPWWDRLALPAFSAVPDAVRTIVLEEMDGDGDRALKEAEIRRWQTHDGTSIHHIATEAEIGTAIRNQPLLTIGAHSWTHRNLARLDAPSLRHELAEPLRWLTERWNTRVVPKLAYPYGLESPAVREAAEVHGYSNAYVVRGRWERGSTDPFAIPRMNVTSTLTPNGFRARLAGLL